MKKLGICVVLSFVCGCITYEKGIYIPPKSLYTPQAVTIEAPYENVWTATVRAFEKRNWAIDNRDKASGYIAKYLRSWDIEEAQTFLDYGQQRIERQGIGVFIDKTMLKYNLLLTKKDEKSTDIEITLNGEAHWVINSGEERGIKSDRALIDVGLSPTTQGKSKGVFENLIISEIKQSVGR